MPDRLVQVIVLADDLDQEGDRFREAGFMVEPGGRHPGRGTENLIVPFGRAGQYLEILAIVDHEQAAASPQGRPVLEALRRRGPGLARWSVEPEDIVATASRLGLPVERRQRTRPDGTVVRWCAVAVDEAWAEPWRSAYMAWDDPALHPGRTAVSHANGAVGLGHLEVAVPEIEAAHRWIGSADLADVRFVRDADMDANADLRLTVPIRDGSILFEPGGWHRQP